MVKQLASFGQYKVRQRRKLRIERVGFLLNRSDDDPHIMSSKSAALMRHGLDLIDSP